MATVAPVSLNDIRVDLIRLEETIIYGLIERSQFALNQKVYEVGAIVPSDVSFLDQFFRETEKVHMSMNRYSSPDEHPFFPGAIGAPIAPLAASYIRTPLPENDVNANVRLKTYYIEKVLPIIARTGEDAKYTATVVSDIAILQAISKRVHLGKYVAEAKIQTHEAEFRSLVAAQNFDGVMELLTHRQVEERLLERVRNKCANYAADIADTGIASESLKVNPEVVVSLYKDWIIPLTKDVEVEYIVQRLKQ